MDSQDRENIIEWLDLAKDTLLEALESNEVTFQEYKEKNESWNKTIMSLLQAPTSL